MKQDNSAHNQTIQNAAKDVSRRLLKRGSLATGLTIVASAFSLVPFSLAHAATTAPANVPQITIVEGHEATGYIQQVLRSHGYQLFKQQVLQNYTGVLSIQEQASAVFHLVDSQNALIAVRIPVSGGEGHSYYVATFLPGTQSIIQTQSALFTLTMDKNVIASIESNGQIISTATFTPQGNVIAGYHYKADGTKVTLDGVALPSLVQSSSCGKACAEGCFGNYGIEIGVASLVLAICTSVCLGLASPVAPAAAVGCAICIVGLTGYDIGVITYCIASCWC
jgi:hypothetical protein